MKSRILYFDFLRGVAIFLVVGIHAFKYLLVSSEIENNLSILFRQLLNCAVPLFIAISGFFISQKVNLKYGEFLKSQLKKIYIPCMLWSFPLFLLAVTNGGSILRESITMFICGYSIYYYIALIIQLYLLIPLLVNIEIKGLVLTGIISVVSVLFITYVQSIKGISLPLLLYAGPFPSWLVFFALGIYLGKIKNRNYSLFPYIILLFVGVVLSFVETKYLYTFHQSGTGFKFSFLFYSFLVIMILFSSKIENLYNENSIVFKCITYLGSISFGIYLIHCYFMLVLDFFHVQLGWLVSWLVILPLSVLVINITKKLFPGSLLYLGFK